MTSHDEQGGLERLGWSPVEQAALELLADPELVPARVVGVDKGRAELLGRGEPLYARLSGRFRLEADALTLPVTGDWVACRRVEGQTVVESLLPRRTYFVRKGSGTRPRPQPIAANVDRVLVVTAAGGDFSPARVERYLAAVHAGGAEPVVVLNKSDLVSDFESLRGQLAHVALSTPVVAISATNGMGMGALRPFLERGKTLALVGSSGVGKSTLANSLLGSERFGTAAVRGCDETGRHKTTRRELVVAPGGYLLVDTPGIRELGLWDAAAGLDEVFADVVALAERCRFRDCGHESEPGCAVVEAMQGGTLPAQRLERYLALSRELGETEVKVRERSAKRDAWRQEISRGARERRKLHRRLGLKDD